MVTLCSYSRDEKPGWGVLFHHLSYFTLPVPSGSCSLSFFSHGWLIAQLLSHSLCSFAKSPLSLNSPPLCLLRFSWVTRSKDAPLVRPALRHSLLKNNRCSRAWRGQVVWLATCPILPVTGISLLCLQTSNMLPLPHPSLSLSKLTHPVCACPTMHTCHCTCSTFGKLSYFSYSKLISLFSPLDAHSSKHIFFFFFLLMLY